MAAATGEVIKPMWKVSAGRRPIHWAININLACGPQPFSDSGRWGLPVSI